jgi:hypothetical protein
MPAARTCQPRNFPNLRNFPVPLKSSVSTPHFETRLIGTFQHDNTQPYLENAQKQLVAFFPYHIAVARSSR